MYSSANNLWQRVTTGVPAGPQGPQGTAGNAGATGPQGPTGVFSGTTPNAIITTNNTSATSTITGALQVVGGAGIGGSVWIGGNVTFTGTNVGIVFNNSKLSSGTVTSTALTVYETGTFVPTIHSLAADDFTSVTYSSYANLGQIGRYTKTGNLVYIEIALQTTAVTTGTTTWNGGLAITGLPYPAATNSLAQNIQIGNGSQFNGNVFDNSLGFFNPPGMQGIVNEGVFGPGGSWGYGMSISLNPAITYSWGGGSVTTGGIMALHVFNTYRTIIYAAGYYRTN